MKDFDAIAATYRDGAKELRGLIPETWKAFGSLAVEAEKDGVLSHKTKELISVAIGIAVQCDGCIAMHARNAVKAGVTREEFAEMVGVAIFMGGGPGSVYGVEALQAYDHFAGS